MPKFSERSLRNLGTAHIELQRVFAEVIEHFDCAVIEGHRDERRQNQLYASGLSKVRWPNSKHNVTPSLAVDVTPWPLDWSDIQRHHYFAGFVLGVATMLGISLRWGGDWDRDTEVKDERFRDLVHFELVEEAR